MRYCVHCFKELPDDITGKFCPECGQEHSTSYAQSYELPAGTYLNNGRYFVGDTLGSGGFGITYLGFDTSLKKKVVIKETFYIGYFKRNVYDKRTSDPLTVHYDNTISLDYLMKKTRKECEALSEGESLNNIMRVYDIFSENNTAYIITEYISGGTLADKIEETGRIEWSVLYADIRPLIRSLSVLHRKGILHRDIKPQNIMIKHSDDFDFEDQYVLIDFGLARSTEVKTLSSMGIAFSPGYSPFEQRSLTQPDGTYTDVYAMAATIYHALTGEAPNSVTNGSLEENFPLIFHLSDTYNVPKNVEEALIYALNPNFNKRCQTLNELLNLLDNKTSVQNNISTVDAGKSLTAPANAQAPVKPAVSQGATVRASSEQAQPSKIKSSTKKAEKERPITYKDIAQPEYSAPKKKKKSGAAMGIIAAAVIICAGVGAALKGGFFERGSSSVDVDDVQSVQTSSAESEYVSSEESKSESKSESKTESAAESKNEETVSLSGISHGIDWSTDPTFGEGAKGVTLKVWCPNAACDIMKSEAAEFTKKLSDCGYGKVNISVVAMGEDNAATQVLTDPSKAGDLFGFASDALRKLVNSGSLIDVTGSSKDYVVNNNSEKSVASASADDKVWAYPETGDNSYCLVYDKKYVSDEQAKTLEGTLKACKAAGKKFCMDAGNGYYSCMFMFTGGLKIDGLEDDGHTQKFTEYDEATLVKTMLAFQQLLAIDYKDVFYNDFKLPDQFRAGTAAAGIDGSWDFKTDKEILGENAGFAALPTINVDGTDTKIVNMFGYKMIGVNSHTLYPHTASALALFLTSEECQLERAQELNWGPSNKKAAENEVVKNDHALTAIIKQSEYSVSINDVSSTFWSPMGTFGEKITDSSEILDENDCKELIKTTIESIRDEWFK